jgi:hypothetical protein
VDASDRLAHVEQAARYKLPAGSRVLVSRELRRLARILLPDEQLSTLAQGRMDDATGLVAVTDRRIVFIGRQLVIEERVLHAQRAEFSFSDLKKVEAEQRSLSGEIVLQVGRVHVVIAGINPPERATEIAQISRSRITAIRKARTTASRDTVAVQQTLPESAA